MVSFLFATLSLHCILGMEPILEIDSTPPPVRPTLLFGVSLIRLFYLAKFRSEVLVRIRLEIDLGT